LAEFRFRHSLNGISLNLFVLISVLIVIVIVIIFVIVIVVSAVDFVTAILVTTIRTRGPIFSAYVGPTAIT